MTDLGADPQLRVALEVARSWGCRPTEFLGIARRMELAHEPGPDGGIRAVTYVDGWSDDDRDLAFALAAYEAEQAADRCPGCGDSLAVTTRRDHEYAYPPAPDNGTRCHRCTGLEIAGAKFEESPQRSALFTRVVLDEGRVAANAARIAAAEEQQAHGGSDREAGAG